MRDRKFARRASLSYSEVKSLLQRSCLVIRNEWWNRRIYKEDHACKAHTNCERRKCVYMKCRRVWLPARTYEFSCQLNKARRRVRSQEFEHGERSSSVWRRGREGELQHWNYEVQRHRWYPFWTLDLKTLLSMWPITCNPIIEKQWRNWWTYFYDQREHSWCSTHFQISGLPHKIDEQFIAWSPKLYSLFDL